MLIFNSVIKYNLKNYSNKNNKISRYIIKFDIKYLKELLKSKFEEIDYNDAKNDVFPFIKK